MAQNAARAKEWKRVGAGKSSLSRLFSCSSHRKAQMALPQGCKNMIFPVKVFIN
tara:strand:- start:373 stop:534 length:162 start_codon:yes stop_codon:yes gene_type:complete